MHTTLSLVLLLLAQSTPQTIGENLLRLEGTDPPSGIHYIRLISILKFPTDSPAQTYPAFTAECWERGGKTSLHFAVRLTGSGLTGPDAYTFTPPVEPTRANLYPTQNPTITLKMRFEGYKVSQDFKRQWESLPNGEYRYRNPGLNTSNLDGPATFLPWLTSLPNLRIGPAKPTPGAPRELVFPLKPLLDLLKNTPSCQP